MSYFVDLNEKSYLNCHKKLALTGFTFLLMNSPIIYLCLFAMFISILVLVFNRGYEKANRFLSGFLFFSSTFSILLYVFLFSNSSKWVAIFVTSIPSTYFLIGPFSYFYVRSIVRDNATLSRIDYLHFVLFIYCFTGTIPFLFSSWQYKLFVGGFIKEDVNNLAKIKLNVLFPYKLNQGIRPFQIGYYMIAQWKLVKNHFKNTRKNKISTKQSFVMKKWLLLYCFIFTLLCIGYSSGIFCTIFSKNKAEFSSIGYKMVLLTLIGYITLIFSLFFFPQVIYGLPIPNELPNLPEDFTIQEDLQDTNTSDTLIVENTEQIVANKPLLFFTEEYMKDIEISVQQCVQEKKYLDNEFSINQLSLFTNIPIHHLSYYFNNILQIKFTDWRTNLRISHSITLIDQGALENITFPALAKQLGFSSYNTFIKAFKAKTNCSPSEYIASNKI